MYEIKSIFPFAWDPNGGGGLGADASPFLWIHMSFGIGTEIFGKLLGLDWSIIERIYYLFPLMGLLIIGPYILFKILFSKELAIISSTIFGLNTYILMIIGGGQLQGVGIAYALIPFLIWSQLKSHIAVRSVGIISLLYSLLLLFDTRIFYISVFISFTAVICLRQNIIKSLLILFGVPIILSILVHSFWIIPLLVYPYNPVENLGEGYASLDAVRFFSFAKLENSIGLLHPNWPENIFGKVGFMKPEFLVFPVLAFSSMFFIIKSQKYKKIVLFFAGIGLVGAFLAKGANPPLGNIYLFLFDNFPGFQMFRDPTKFYVLTALSYSILIPFALGNIFKILRKISTLLFAVTLVITLVLFLFVLWPAVSGQLGGTFKTTTIPSDYRKLEKFLQEDKTFYRTLWVPELQRYGFYTHKRPAVSLNLYKTKLAAKNLEELSIRYVIVPNDVNGEIFVTDRKYDNRKYTETVKSIQGINGLKEIPGFGSIRVFEVSNPRPHIWSENEDLIRNIHFINPTLYKIDVKNAKKGDIIVFSEAFDSLWFGRKEETFRSNPVIYKSLASTPYNQKLNSFVLKEDGDYVLDIYYLKQKHVVVGVFVSIVTLVGILAIVLYSINYDKKKAKK